MTALLAFIAMIKTRSGLLIAASLVALVLLIVLLAVMYLLRPSRRRQRPTGRTVYTSGWDEAGRRMK